LWVIDFKRGLYGADTHYESAAIRALTDAFLQRE
jgi:hypothetical protein